MESAEKQRNYELAEKLLSEQNFGVAVVAGLVATILSAGTYGIAKSLAEGVYYSISGAVLGVLIGVAMQVLGRGVDRKYVVVASVFALSACLLGNMFAVVMDVARATAVSPFDVLRNTAISELYDWLFKNLHFADLMFWSIGTGGAAYFARRSLTREESLALHTYKMSQ